MAAKVAGLDRLIQQDGDSAEDVLQGFLCRQSHRQATFRTVVGGGDRPDPNQFPHQFLDAFLQFVVENRRLTSRFTGLLFYIFTASQLFKDDNK